MGGSLFLAKKNKKMKWNGRSYRPANAQFYTKKKPFDFEEALKPYGEKEIPVWNSIVGVNVPPTQGPEPTPTNTPSNTPTPSITASQTPTPSVTATHTQTPTNTQTHTPTNTPTNTHTPTSTPTQTSTVTPTQTATHTPTNTQTPSTTPSNTPTNTPSVTATNTPSVTASNTPTTTQTNTPTNTSTPTQTTTPTPSATCPQTTQYLEVDLFESTKFKLILWNDSGFSSPASALCNYVVSGAAYGDLGTVYTGTETILEGQHQKQFNLAPVLQPGEVVTGFTVYSINTTACQCPVNVIFSTTPTTPTPTASNTPTPTPTVTSTQTPTVTTTNTASPTNTPTSTQTQTPTQTQTGTPTGTPTNTPTNTSTNTPSITPTNTETPTSTPTQTPTPTSAGFDCSWSAITETWENNSNQWNECEPVPPTTQTPTPSITASNTPTPTNTATQTQTPTNTPTNTNTPTPSITASQTPTPTSSPLPPLQFWVASGETAADACGSIPNFFVYSTDLGNCGGCTSGGLTCWACLNTTQTLYYDAALTQPVITGYYSNEMSSGNYASWYTVSGLLQPGGFAGCSVSPDADAITYLNAVTTAGATLDYTISGATNTLFKQLKSIGVYSKLYVFYPFLGGTAATTAINAKNPGTFNMTWNGGVYFSPGNSGYVQSFGVNGYGNTGWDDANDGTAGLGFGIWTDTDSNEGASVFDMGATNASYRSRMNVRHAGQMIGTIRDNTIGTTYTAANVPSNGLNILQRTGVGEVKGYRNGGSIGATAIVEEGKATTDVYVMASNNNGTLSGLSNREFQWAHIQQYLTDGEIANFHTALLTFNITIGK